MMLWLFYKSEALSIKAHCNPTTTTTTTSSSSSSSSTMEGQEARPCMQGLIQQRRACTLETC